MLDITFEGATFDRRDPADRFDLLLGVNATIQFSIAGRKLFGEVMFPIVELRDAFARWTSTAFKSDFEYESLESDEAPLIWIRRVDENRWRVGSALLGAPDSDPVLTADMTSSVSNFIAQVDDWVEHHLGVVAADVLLEE
jgi:hypothetical protein